MDTQIDPIALLSESIKRLPELEAENAHLQESIAEVRAMLAQDDAGWQLVQGLQSGERLEGLELDEVKDIINLLQPRVAAAGLTRRAASLHAGWVFGKGVQIEGTTAPTGRGNKPAVYKFFTNRVNQESLFSASAHEELQNSRFIEGNVLVACDTVKKIVQRIPFNQIIGIKVDPDFPTRILAYKRQWDRHDDTDNTVQTRWYLTHRFEGKKPTHYGTGKDRVPVDPNITVVDLRAGRQPGFVLGVPDGISGLNWAETYTLAMRAGVTVTEGLSRLIFKVTSKTKQGAQAAAVKIGGMSGAGNTSSMVEGQDVEAIRTAGQAYAFEKLMPLAAIAAAAWNVSVADLLNSSASSGSYGSLQAISAGNRNAMTLMQRQWTTFFQDIFDVMGFGRPDVHWEPLETPDPYRASQSLALLSSRLSPEEDRAKALDILDITGDPNQIPDSLKALQVDPSATPTAAQQASPDQGVSNGGGNGGQGANDLRNDSIGENLRHEMALSGILEEMRGLVERFEATKGD